MKWQFGRRSDNIEDQRGSRAPVIVGGGIGTILLALLVTFLGGDPSVILQQGQPPSNNPPTDGQRQAGSPANDTVKDFVSVVLADTEDTWDDLFRRMGGTYEKPKLVLFSGAVQSACGYAKSAMGPFYCPRDRKVYLDTSFFNDLKNQHNAPGDFAQAYVIAHEIGHHVQNLLGISGKVQAMQRQVSQQEANQLSVRLELQADCFAGVWGNRAEKSRQILEQGDIEEALNAASQIGDDRLQEQARGYVVPDAFTHGSSAQRVAWFKRGIESGDVRQCNTFAGR